MYLSIKIKFRLPVLNFVLTFKKEKILEYAFEISSPIREMNFKHDFKIYYFDSIGPNINCIGSAAKTPNIKERLITDAALDVS